MKIHNFRVGFATNSSSSHSVVLLPPEMVGKVSPIGESYGDYGWSYFRLTEPEDKLRYLAAQFFSNSNDKDIRQMVVDRLKDEVPGLENIDVDDEYSNDIYVDHQSVLNIENPNADLFERMIGFFSNPRVVVLGGNDNDDEDTNSVPGAQPVEFLNRLMTDGAAPGTLREDGPYMVAFDPRDGTKMRFSFNDTGGECSDYVKATAPELVDLKITNYCAGGCSFCYQASTEKGRHGSLEDIKRHIDILAGMRVFEVAIGGGEPTDHPDFAEILAYADAKGVVPNFTTMSDRWLTDENIVDAVALHVGGIGVSCHDVAGLTLVDAVKTALRGRKYNNKRWRGPTVSAQHVVGSVPIPATGEFLSAAFAARTPVLLLGYKEVGFGKTFAHYEDDNIAVALTLAIQGKATSSVSVDTALVDRYPDLMQALNVPHALITSPEGKFSCYIDAVMNKMGPSSYVEPKTMTPAPKTVEEFLTVFATY